MPRLLCLLAPPVLSVVPRARRALRIGAVIAALLPVAAACSGGPTGGDDPPRTNGPILRVVSGADLADTVEAFPAAPLVVEVRDSLGAPAANVRVVFTPDTVTGCAPTCGVQPSLFVAPVGEVFLARTATVRTDAAGRAAVKLGFARVAADVRVHLTAPDFGLRATARYTIRPGQPARLVVSPRDTGVFLGASVAVSAAATDRWGNLRAEAATLAAPGLRRVGGTFAGDSVGVYPIVASLGTLPPATGSITVVPRGMVAGALGFRSSQLVVANLDGSGRRVLDVGDEIKHLAWTPDGTRLVVGVVLPPARLWSVSLEGTRVDFAAVSGGPRWPLYGGTPVLSPDARWIYLSTNDVDGSGVVARVRPDGTGYERLWTANTPFTVPEQGLGVAPTGDRVALLMQYQSTVYPHLLDFRTGAITRLELPRAGVLRWSPRGDLLAHNPATGPQLLGLDGRVVRTFVMPFRGSSDPTFDWSADGRFLLYKSGSGLLELGHVETGRTTPLWFTSAFWNAVLSR